MIEVKNVSFKYGSGKKKEYSLNNISLHVKQGECVVITGESGCGKTTLTRVLNGLCPRYFEGRLRGYYKLNGETVFSSESDDEIELNEDYKKTIDEIGTVVGNVFQDPRSQFFATNTTDEVVLAMENRNFDRELMRNRLEELDQLMEIRKLLDRNIFKLSSGEKQKVAIAGACAVKPKVIVLDEPSANLDADGTEKLGQLLRQLKEEGYTIIISEHRLSYLKDISDRMIIMSEGRIIKDLDGHAIDNITDDEMIKLGLRILSDASDFSPTGMKMGDSPVLIVDNIKYRRGDRILFDGFSASFYRGQITAITGPNGIGKTTLCRIISGELKQQKGKVNIFGENTSARKRTHDCFFMEQDADYQIFTEKVLKEVVLNTEWKVDDEEVLYILRDFDLWEYKDRHPASLSGGQKQRVILAAAILRQPSILILDEPTSGLDGRHMRVIAKHLREIAAKGTCILVITHDREFINIVADTIIEL